VTDDAPQIPHESKRPSGVSKNTFFFAMALVALIGFIAGTRSSELYASIAPVFGIKASSDTLDLSSVQKAYQELKANYDGELDTAALVNGASRGMVAAAGDRYTVFMDQKEAADFAKELNGEVSGIGAEIGLRDDQPTVLRVLANSPAEAAGVQARDIFITVNDESVAGLDSAKVASKIRGEAGTSVKITVMRGDETKEFTIVRAKVSDTSVRWSMSDGIGTMIISRFDDQTGKLARQAAEEFKAQNVRGVILDVRDNGGGYLEESQKVTGLWLNDKTVVTEKTGGKVIDTIKTGTAAVLQDIPTVVLINGNSASASEIVAGALQDHGVAKLVGEKTYGKGSVQKLITLPGGRELKVTIAKWYTPNGKNINAEGISPDVKVALTSEDMNAGRDPQLDAAKEALK